MDKRKDKIKEPFKPEDTPTPAQFPDPKMRTDKDQSNRKKPDGDEAKDEGKLLSDDTEIADETTI